jgi:hypothetical protein
MSRALAAALLGAAAVSGCGSGSGDQSGAVRATVQRYFAAVAAQQPGAACAQLSEESRQRLADVATRVHAVGAGCEATMRTVLASTYGRRLARLEHPQILKLSIDGDKATASVDGVDRPLALVHRGEGWRIDFVPSVED